MKKYILTLVTLFVTMTAAAQMVVKSTVWETVVYPGTGIYGYSYPTDKLPGSYEVGVDFNSQLYKNLQEVYSREGYTAYQKAAYKAAQIRPKIVDVTEYVNTMGMLGMGMTGMGMTGMPMLGMYGMGGGNTSTGMVGGAGGMAGATSNVHIDNSNMLSTVGSGIDMQYNSGTNSLSFRGDPLMAIGRVVAGIGGSKKKNQQVQYQQQYQQVQPVQPQQQTTNGSATRSNSDVSSGY